jgi:putative endonuclease
MYFVYIIKSLNWPEEFYIGSTADIQSRVAAHNSGNSPSTKSYKPWALVWHCQFVEKCKALEFEKYLKSHSGRSFMHKRLL